ncbi:hypothetical protein Plhal304r1_c015g0056161 [Plasmopara halstedii]
MCSRVTSVYSINVCRTLWHVMPSILFALTKGNPVYTDENFSFRLRKIPDLAAVSDTIIDMYIYIYIYIYIPKAKRFG